MLNRGVIFYSEMWRSRRINKENVWLCGSELLWLHGRHFPIVVE